MSRSRRQTARTRCALPIAVRAYPPLRERQPGGAPRGPGLVLVFDTETTVDAAQRLLFG